MVFPFLELPGEIRNQIFRLVLTHNTPVVIRSANQLAAPEHTKLYLCPHILLVSWRTYYEGVSILYGENCFQAHRSYLASMLFAMDPARTVIGTFCASLFCKYHVRVRLGCDPFYTPEAVRKAFSGADSLEVEVFRSSWGIGGYDALEGFGSVQNVRKPRVHGSIGPKLRSVARMGYSSS